MRNADIAYEPGIPFADPTRYLATLPPDTPPEMRNRDPWTGEEPYDRDYSPIEDREPLFTRQEDTLEGFFSRYPVQQYGVWFMGGALLLLSMCSSFDRDDERASAPIVSDYPAIEEPDDSASRDIIPADVAGLNGLAEDLFGEGVRWEQVETNAPELASRLGGHAADWPDRVDERYGILRLAMIAARPNTARGDNIRFAYLQRAWLMAARDIGQELCHSVMEHALFSGAPVLSKEWQGYEQQLAADMLLSQSLAASASDAVRTTNALPDWALQSAAGETGLSITTVQQAVAVPGAPARCDVHIAILNALIERADEAPDDAFMSL